MRYATTNRPMMNELLVEKLKDIIFGAQAFQRFSAEEREVLDIAIQKIENIKFGYWIEDTCTNCGYGVNPWNHTPYCPNCGAQMIGD